MPFKSLAQAGYLHSHPEILGKKGLSEWDAATKGKHLPKHVKKSKKKVKGGNTNIPYDSLKGQAVVHDRADNLSSKREFKSRKSGKSVRF